MGKTGLGKTDKKEGRLIKVKMRMKNVFQENVEMKHKKEIVRKNKQERLRGVAGSYG